MFPMLIILLDHVFRFDPIEMGRGVVADDKTLGIQV